MPRFFFHIQGGSNQSHTDEVGEELQDRMEAWRLATRYAGELLRDWNGKIHPNTEWCLEVTDERRRPLYHIIVKSHQDDEQAIVQE